MGKPDPERCRKTLKYCFNVLKNTTTSTYPCAPINAKAYLVFAHLGVSCASPTPAQRRHVRCSSPAALLPRGSSSTPSVTTGIEHELKKVSSSGSARATWTIPAVSPAQVCERIRLEHPHRYCVPSPWMVHVPIANIRTWV